MFLVLHHAGLDVVVGVDSEGVVGAAGEMPKLAVAGGTKDGHVRRGLL